MFDTPAYAGFSPTTPLGPHTIDRRDPGPTDVQIDILFCGVCHSDLHTVKSEWTPPVYPCIPGHEIVGRVTALGSDANGFKVSDVVGVGCLVDSCRQCASCTVNLEQFCELGATWTYGSADKRTGGPTYGGYSTTIVVDQHFVLHMPPSLDLAAAAPLLCAGITTYSPMRHWEVGPGKRVGVVGLGGLGHMAVKIAHAMGAHVSMFTTSAAKETAARRLGADQVVLSRDDGQMKQQANSLDFILDTVAASHDLNPYLMTLAREGAMVLVGGPPTPHPPVIAGKLVAKRRMLAGSLIGGLKETQEMLDFCATHGIAADIEMIRMQQINEAYERMLRSDVKYRFVIDMASLKT